MRGGWRSGQVGGCEAGLAGWAEGRAGKPGSMRCISYVLPSWLDPVCLVDQALLSFGGVWRQEGAQAWGLREVRSSGCSGRDRNTRWVIKLDRSLAGFLSMRPGRVDAEGPSIPGGPEGVR